LGKQIATRHHDELPTPDQTQSCNPSTEKTKTKQDSTQKLDGLQEKKSTNPTTLPQLRLTPRVAGKRNAPKGSARAQKRNSSRRDQPEKKLTQLEVETECTKKEEMENANAPR
jgi:hypothetical protein